MGIVWAARGSAAGALLIGLISFAGYLRQDATLVRVRPGFEAMSPITALGLLSLAAGVLLLSFGRAGPARLAAVVAGAIGVITLSLHAAVHQDALSPWVAERLFGYPPAMSGRTSIATAASLLLLAISLIVRRRRLAADLAAACAAVIAGTALMGYVYGVKDLYAIDVFRTMALNTALSLFLLSLALLLVRPSEGWAAILAAGGPGGGATRRQLAFLVVPPIMGWALVEAVHHHTLGPDGAMALLVMATVVPLAALVLRDGRLLSMVDAERRAKADLQEHIQTDLEHELGLQAAALAAESGERAKAEAALFRSQRMEAVGQLTGGIAHDFNNLLMAIGGNLQLLDKRLGHDHPAYRYLANATSAVDKGAKLTGQLLAFSRTQRLEPRPVELDRSLTAARDLLGNALGPDIDIRLDLAAPGAWALTDPDQLDLSILNLALNARDAMPLGGTVTVASRPCRHRLAPEGDEHEYLSVRISDTGVGMPQDVVEKAMEPFFTTKDRGKGTGLGLAQAYGFVRQCGGDIRIESHVGEGTTIELLLLCAPKPEKQAPDRPTEAAGASAMAPQGARRSLLIIDDDDSVREVLVEALRAAGYDVMEAKDGAAGLEALGHTVPAAAIIDFIMPGMNGAEVARRAREMEPTLPIIFVSGYSDTAALDGISGAVVVRKPVDLDGLQRTIFSVLN